VAPFGSWGKWSSGSPFPIRSSAGLTEAVDLTLRHLAGQPMNRSEALEMRGAQAMGCVPADTGPSS
jgi:hypothetical protein